MTFVRESPQYVREGETRQFALIWEGATTVATGSDSAFVNGSSQGWLTGSVSISGNVETTRTLTVPAGAGGVTIVWEITATVDGDVRTQALQLEVLKPGQEM